MWSIKEDLPFNSGTLTTGGNSRSPAICTATSAPSMPVNGKVLWSKNLGSGIGAGPVTYSVDGKQ